MAAEALWYLGSRTVRNAAAARLARLRNPRYALAMVAALLYFWLMFFRRSHGGGAPAGVHPAVVEIGAAIALLLIAAWAWIFGSERALAFSPAEVSWLFPAPVSRRALVRYKLARGQVAVLFNTLLWLVLFAAERVGTITWYKAIAVWVLLSTLQLHRLGASFVRANLREHGVSAVKRQAVSLVVLGVAVAGVASLISGIIPALGGVGSGGGFAASLAAAAHRPLAAAVLWPFLAMSRPMTATSAEAWGAAIGPALLILAAHYLWVLRSDTAFEEAAADASFRQATRRQHLRAGVPLARGQTLSPPLYRLPPGGFPAGAIFWKNVTMLARLRRVRMLAIAVIAGAVGLAAWSYRASPATVEAVATLLAVWGGFLVLAAPLWIRNDLRADLLELELIKTLPIGGRALVAAEIAAGAAVASAVQLALLVLAYAAVMGDFYLRMPLGERTLLLAGAAIASPIINVAGFTIQNALALTFPGWARLGPQRGGIEAMGQTFLVMMGQAVALLVLLVPPALAAGAVAWLTAPLLGEWRWAAGGLVAIAGIGFELVLAVDWLGMAFERIDITALPARDE